MPAGGSLAVLGLGPIGDMATRVAQHRGVETVIGVDLVPERLERARKNDVQTIDLREHGKDLGDVVRGLTGGRGPDAVIDAVGMEAHGSPVGAAAQQAHRAAARRGGVEAHAERGRGPAGRAVHRHRPGPPRRHDLAVGVYGGAADPMPMLAAVRQAGPAADGPGATCTAGCRTSCRCSTDDDPLGVDDFATHHLPLEEAPQAYETFQKKQDGMVKVLLQPRQG